MKRCALWIVVVACAAWSSAGPTDTPAPKAQDTVAEIRALEVRLRKLYLVRPDLMAYPVPYDVVC